MHSSFLEKKKQEEERNENKMERTIAGHLLSYNNSLTKSPSGYEAFLVLPNI
jgi:hypothetical protein